MAITLPPKAIAPSPRFRQLQEIFGSSTLAIGDFDAGYYQ